MCLKLTGCYCYDPVTTQNPITDPLGGPKRDATAYLNSAIINMMAKIDNLKAVAASILTPAKNQNLVDQKRILDEISKASNDLLSLLDYSSPCFYISEDVINMRDEYYSQIIHCTALSINLIDSLWNDVDVAVANGNQAITDITAKFNECGNYDMTCFTNFKNNAPANINANLAAIQIVLNSLTSAANTAAINGNSCRQCAFLNFQTDYNSMFDAIYACLDSHSTTTKIPPHCFSP